MTAPVFANSAFVDTPEWLVLRGGRWHKRPLYVRYGLFLDAKTGPVLIDTGYTNHALRDPGRSLGLRLYGRALGARLQDSGQPEAFLARFSLRPRDITTVVVTHFHADHVSGLRLFAQARFVAAAAGWDALRANSSIANLRHGVFPELLPPDFSDRLDLIDAAPQVAAPLLDHKAHDLLGDGSLLALPLPGHAPGHVGLIFPALGTPLLYAVDAQWTCAALPAQRRPGLAARLVSHDRAAHARSCDLVTRFAEAGGDVMLCHDPAPSAFDLKDLPCG